MKYMGVFFVLLFTSPFWGALFFLEPTGVFLSDFLYVFSNNLLQSLLSALLSIILGLLGAFGLMGLEYKKPKLFYAMSVLTLLPAILPPLFLLLVSLSLFPSIPFGLTGIVLLHALINSGVCAVSLAQATGEKVGSYSEVAWLMGASRLKYFIWIFIPLMKRQLLLLFLFVTLVCLGSFSIPLVLGGLNFTTTEAYIYEMIFSHGDWSQALTIGVLQSLFIIFLVSILSLNKIKGSDGLKINKNIKFSFVPLSMFVVLPSLVLLFGYVYKVIIYGLNLKGEMQIPENFITMLTNSLSVSLGCGFLSFLFLVAISYFYRLKLVRTFFNSWTHPSAALLSLILMIINWGGDRMSIFLMALGMAFLWTVALFRLQLAGKLIELDKDFEQCLVMGAGFNKAFFKVVFPQILPSLCWLSALAAFWASGEFALSDVVSQSTLTLSQWVKSLLSNYRLELAFLYSVPMLFVGLMSFTFFGGLACVSSRWLKKRI